MTSDQPPPERSVDVGQNVAVEGVAARGDGLQGGAAHFTVVIPGKHWSLPIFRMETKLFASKLAPKSFIMIFKNI